MAVQKIKEGNVFNVYNQSFLIDETSDLDELENEYTCLMGDKAQLPDGTIYVRHSDEFQGELWEEIEKTEPISSLPTIYSDDNGKLLGVEDESWTLINIPKELPNIDSNDVGKTLIVKDSLTGEFQIAPYQNITIEDLNEGSNLNNINNSYVAIGVECFIEIDMNEYIGTIDDNFHLSWGDNSEYIDFNTGKIYLNSIGYYAVQVSTLGTKYYWDKIDNIPNYGEKSYETILNTTSFTTAEDNGYYKCDDVCSLASLIDGDVIKVTFDGDEYEVEAKVSRYGKAIGDNVNNFTNYPFYINTGTFPGNATLYTEEAGTYSIKIERKIITPSKEFSDAAFASIKYVKFMTAQLLGGTQITCNYSRDEVWNMFEDEAPVIASIDGVLCAQGMKYLYPGMIQFRVLDFTSDNNTPVLKERIISVNEYNTPEFSYSENLYELTAHN